MVSWLLRQGIAPDVIPNGSKLMAINLPAHNIRLIDSFNFLPMGLAKLPSCFGLTATEKGYFPHYFNTKDNQNYKGPFPEPRYYGPEMMSNSARSAFLAWYEQHKLEEFDFKDEMEKYCKYVIILV